MPAPRHCLLRNAALWLGMLTLANCMALPAAPASEFKVLVFSKTAGFRHTSIPNGIAAIRQLGTNNNFEVSATENAADFTDSNLVQFAAVIFLSTTGDVLDAAQQSVFERYIRGGGGYVGIHAASDTEYSWPWYGGLVGAYFSSHPAIQKATVVVENFGHSSTHFLPEGWSRTDEWYNFQTNPRGNVQVLARLDESTYTGGTMGGDHPICWTHHYDGGRAWYTAGGHTPESFAEPLFLTHLLGGIHYAAIGVTLAPPRALMLFDGRTASPWTSVSNNIGMPWQVTNGSLTVLPGSGSIRTVQAFEDYLLHLEFSVPRSAPGTAEGSLANSGVYLQDQFEIQILDSYGRPVLGANETGAIWNQRDPSTNAARPTAAWESLDIEFQSALWEGARKVADARASVWWNGVLVQDGVDILAPTDGGSATEKPPPAPIRLQDLVGAVQFRNIWLLPTTMAPRGIAVEIVSAGSQWRYLDDGSSPLSAWPSNNYADGSWRLQRAQLGYGDGDETTVIRSNRTDGTRIITTYFRKSFTATNTDSMTQLELRVLRDDGAIVYLNGTEVFRSNMPNGPVDSTTTALAAIGNAQEIQWISTHLNPSLLIEGTNLLAVEIHQSGTTSTDVTFDLALSALRFDPPQIWIQPIGNEFTFQWAALPTGYQPETADLLGPDGWTMATNPVSTVPGVRSSLTVTNDGRESLFFRLRKN